jgi:hypothetical protein
MLKNQKEVLASPSSSKPVRNSRNPVTRSPRLITSAPWEPRLADAAGASQRDQSMSANEAHNLGDLSVTADQFGNRCRQVRRRQRRSGLHHGHCRTGALVRAP